MHLASFSYQGVDRIGARIDETHLVDFASATAALGAALPADMMAFIAGGASMRALAEQLLKRAADPASGIARISMAEVRWHPPLRRPGKFVGVAVNNNASDARKISAPDHPLFFMKPTTCLLGHGEPIMVRSYYGGSHPEPELGVIIGRHGRDLDPRSAMDWVYGYTIVNDVTGNAMRADDQLHYWALYADPNDPDKVERREQHLSYAARYKGTDGFGPAGPFLVTADAVPDPHSLDVTCLLDDDIVAEDSTQFLTYKVAEVLAYLSRFHTLEPGDLISMGTAFREKPGSKRSLHAADFNRIGSSCTITISGLGTLANPVVREDRPLGEWRLPKPAAALP